MEMTATSFVILITAAILMTSLTEVRVRALSLSENVEDLDAVTDAQLRRILASEEIQDLISHGAKGDNSLQSLAAENKFDNGDDDTDAAINYNTIGSLRESNTPSILELIRGLASSASSPSLDQRSRSQNQNEANYGHRYSPSSGKFRSDFFYALASVLRKNAVDNIIRDQPQPEVRVLASKRAPDYGGIMGARPPMIDLCRMMGLRNCL